MKDVLLTFCVENLTICPKKSMIIFEAVTIMILLPLEILEPNLNSNLFAGVLKIFFHKLEGQIMAHCFYLLARGLEFI